MVVRIRLFAQLRERAGADSIEAVLDDGATVADALRQLSHGPPLGELLARLPVRMAVNRELASADTALHAGDELALLPPVSGGSDPHVRVTARSRSTPRASPTSCAGRAPGAIVTFEGTVRDVEFLDYEAYREMAEEMMARIVSECVERHGLEAAAVEHRVGRVALGEPGWSSRSRPPTAPRPSPGARDDRPDQGPGADLEAGARRRRGALGALRGGGLAVGEPLTHLDSGGNARMVDVGAKPVTERRARARARVRMSRETAAAIATGNAPKGEVLGTARLAGILAAKQTAALIPLAHPIALSFVDRRGQRGRGARSGRADLRGRGRGADGRRDGGDGRLQRRCADRL